MDQQNHSQPRWEGKLSATLAKATADQVWSFLIDDFFGMHKYFPGASTSYGVHGNNGEVGCIRYIAFSLDGSNDNSDDAPKTWVKERLVAIDPVERTFSYDIVEGNVGFNSYLGKYKVIPGVGDDNGGCTLEWSFGLDPIEGLKLEDLQKILEGRLQLAAKKMDETVGHLV